MIPLTAEDVHADEQLNDGLPYTLEENIRAYGLSYFKIKVRGDRDADLNRLRKIADVLETSEVDEPSLTLDGNEQFASVDAFRDFYETCKADTKIGKLFKGLLLVEAAPAPRCCPRARPTRMERPTASHH